MPYVRKYKYYQNSNLKKPYITKYREKQKLKKGIFNYVNNMTNINEESNDNQTNNSFINNSTEDINSDFSDHENFNDLSHEINR